MYIRHCTIIYRLNFVVFSIKDLDVKDPMPNAKAPVIVTKVEKHKDIMQLDVSCFVVIMHTCT